MPKAVLEGRFTDVPVEDEPNPAEPQDPPTDPEVPAGDATPADPAPVEAPAPAADPVDDKGVPLKNRLAEAQRKEAAARKKAADLEAQNRDLQAKLDAAKVTAAPAAPAAPAAAQPAAVNQQFDVEALRRTPVQDWPRAALLQLERESPEWSDRVQEILANRLAQDVATRATANMSLADRTKRIDRELVTLYPDLRDPESEMHQTTAAVVVEWGLDVRRNPEAMRAAVREAAERLGMQPAATPRRTPSMVPDVDEGGQPRVGRGRAAQPALNADQQRMAQIFNISPEQLAAEVTRTANEPLIGRELL